MNNPTYSQIIDSDKYIRLMGEHRYIPESDDYIVECVAKQSGNSVLELGCGPGRLTHKIARVVPVVGVDHDMTSVQHGIELLTRMSLMARMVCANVSDYVCDSPVNMVVSQGMHHHIPKHDVPIYLTQVQRNLKPGGLYIVGDEFLAEYANERSRRIVATLWYAHIITMALYDGHHDLATEEAKTYLDDLAMGEENPKSQEQIDTVLAQVSSINEYLSRGNIQRARMEARLLVKHVLQTPITVSGNPQFDLSRGDLKVSGKVFRTEVDQAGFDVLDVRWFGPIDVAGAMGVFTLRKR